MSDSYTVLWTKAHCVHIRKYDQMGLPFRLLFGGPHSSEPRFSRYGVKAGDWIYPVYVSGGDLHVIGRMQVERLLTQEEFIAQDPEGLATWWQGQLPALDYLAPTYTDEAAIGTNGSLIRLNAALPAEALERLRFCSQRGERGLKYVVDGKLKSVVSLQGGVYRLSAESAQELEAVVVQNL